MLDDAARLLLPSDPSVIATVVDGRRTTDADADADVVAHLTGRQAGAGARAAGVGRLVITHVLPGLDGEVHRRDAEHAFGAPVALAAPGATYPL